MDATNKINVDESKMGRSLIEKINDALGRVLKNYDDDRVLKDKGSKIKATIDLVPDKMGAGFVYVVNVETVLAPKKPYLNRIFASTDPRTQEVTITDNDPEQFELPFEKPRGATARS